MSRSVLLIEDDALVREILTDLLIEAGYKTKGVMSGEEGVELIRKTGFDIVLTDLNLPGIHGIDVIKTVKTIAPSTVCIMLTGKPTVESAVEAMKAGAFTYLKKPIEKEELLVTLDKACEVFTLRSQNAELKSDMKRNYISAILGSSFAAHQVRSTIEKVADTDSTVLITGESGTGKELVARALHFASSRSERPFVPINCGAIPEDLLESELFGHEKGAFTGAIATKIGRFEAANLGTVFLDEIGDMSPGLQVKILRVLQEKQFERVGGRNTISVDVRVVAATNQDLEKAVEEKKFRNDLFYRLNVIPIVLPPLRVRKEDIALLAAHFVDKISRQKKKIIRGLSSGALAVLEDYDWPGNIRELENLIERIIVLKSGGGVIEAKDLPEKLFKPDNRVEKKSPMLVLDDKPIDFNAVVDKFERELILNALNRSRGVKKKAAEFLGINRTTLIEKMKRKGLISSLDEVREP